MSETTVSEAGLRLLEAILEAYDAYHVSKDVTGDGHPETFCNFSVDHVLMRMNYEKMRSQDGKPMMANQMIDYMTRSADWSEIPMSEAQGLANDGRVVVAGRAEAEHGHVVVVRPGVPVLSGKYGNAKTPKVSHVGKGSYIGRTVAWAFNDPKPWPAVPPKFWLLKEEV